MFDKRKTKGQFNPTLLTNAGNWMKDKDWQKRSNHLYQSMEQAREDHEMQIVRKKHQQKQIQYTALADQYKLHVKQKRF